MPVDFSSSVRFAQDYSDFSRASQLPTWEARAPRIVAALEHIKGLSQDPPEPPIALDADDSILVLGCGFGWGVEALRSTLGRSNIWGMENSGWLTDPTRWATEQPTLALGTDVGVVDVTAGNAATLRQAVGDLTGSQRHPWIVTEDVLPCFEDAWTGAIHQQCTGLLPGGTPDSHVLHIVTPLYPGVEQSPVYNWRSMASWAADAEVGSHSFLQRGGQTLWVAGSQVWPMGA